jgi:RNA polymerase sigma-70 factor, ECF subfamily
MLDGENKIISSAVEGEASAFGLLYDHYHPKIYRFVLIKVSRREEAEDLTHEVFLSAWQKIGGYVDMGFPFSSWLYRIARNEVIDHYRGNKGNVSLENFEPETLPVEFQEDESANIDLKMELNRVRKAILQLKPDYQDVIVMRFIEDMPIKEVAAVLEKSEGAVKLMQNRAVKELKKLL